MTDFIRHPGLMVYSESNMPFEIIHADWPVYPIGHGWNFALETIACFPIGQRFYSIDDIDQVLLCLIANPKDIKGDVFDSKHMHAAFWHEDLKVLFNKGFIGPIHTMSESEWKFKRYKQIFDDQENIPDFIELKTDTGIVRVDKPIIDTDDDCRTFVSLNGGYFELTTLGNDYLIDSHKEYNFESILDNKVVSLFKHGFYDSAVREASIFLESDIRHFEVSKLFGRQLIDLHYNNLIKRIGYETAFLKCYRMELRTAFAYIRNEYAHGFPITTPKSAENLLKRIGSLVDSFRKLADR